MRTDMSHDLHKLREWIPFDIELDVGMAAKKFGNIKNIQRPDMALIRTRMHRDAVRSSANRGFDSFDDAGDADVARVAEQCDLVHVDAELGHKRFAISCSVRRTQTSTISRRQEKFRSVLSRGRESSLAA